MTKYKRINVLPIQCFKLNSEDVIFGCTRHSSNKFGSALVGTKICRVAY